MEANFWLQRWADNLIGFHQREINPYLKDYWSALEPEAGGHVFVPLCGKSLDMLWLAERAPVLGVELSETAVRDFFADNRMQATHTETDEFGVYETADVRLLCGDFFDLQAAQLAGVQAVYDRAALIALPPEMRARYVAHLDCLLPSGVSMLLVTMNYDQAQMGGPPFAVPENEVQALFDRHWTIEKLHTRDILAEETRFAERGVSLLEEQIYLLNKQ